jgi:hypothetical protein
MFIENIGVKMSNELTKREFGGWWIWILVLTMISAGAFFGLRMVGVFGERVVFENSFQYSEARKTEIAIFSAQLVEIDRKISNSETGSAVRNNLEAQAAAIRIQISTARAKQR